MAFSRPCPSRVELVVVPGAGLFDDVPMRRQIEQIAFVADAAVEHDVELGLAERRSDLVLHHAGPGAVADGDFPFLDRPRSADVDADRGIELQARPPGVVSGLPNITPIFSRS